MGRLFILIYILLVGCGDDPGSSSFVIDDQEPDANGIDWTDAIGKGDAGDTDTDTGTSGGTDADTGTAGDTDIDTATSGGTDTDTETASDTEGDTGGSDSTCVDDKDCLENGTGNSCSDGTCLCGLIMMRFSPCEGTQSHWCCSDFVNPVSAALGECLPKAVCGLPECTSDEDCLGSGRGTRCKEDEGRCECGTSMGWQEGCHGTPENHCCPDSNFMDSCTDKVCD